MPVVRHDNNLVDILLVEDNEDDVELTSLAFLSTDLPNRLHVARDGIEGLAFLHRRAGYEQSPRPNLILLDLNMPRMDGRELLVRVKSDAQLRNIPVIVLTTSDSEADISRAYDLHANAYVTKPVDYSKFVEVTDRIVEHWFQLVRLPPHESGRNEIPTCGDSLSAGS